jgi:hypothetical protein
MKAEVQNMELLNNKNESRKFYREVKTLRKPFNPKKKENVNIISDNQEILERWWRYFDTLLNQGTGRGIAGDEENKDGDKWQQSEQREDEIDAPSMEETRKAL